MSDALYNTSTPDPRYRPFKRKVVIRVTVGRAMWESAIECETAEGEDPTAVDMCEKALKTILQKAGVHKSEPVEIHPEGQP